MTQPTPPEPTVSQLVCGEPADRSRFFRCQKPANHYGERHQTVIPGGDFTWGYVPTPDEAAEVKP